MGNIEATIGYLYYTKEDLEINTPSLFNLTEEIEPMVEGKEATAETTQTAGFYVGMAFVGITLGAIVGVIANLLSKRFCFKTREGNSASSLVTHRKYF